LQTGQPLRLSTPADDPKYYDTIDGCMGYQPRNMLMVPITWTPPGGSSQGVSKLGVLAVINKIGDELTPDWFGDTDIELLGQIGSYVASAVKNSQDHDEDALALSVAQAVHEVQASVLCDLWDADMPAVTKACRDVVCCDVVRIFITDIKKKELHTIGAFLSGETTSSLAQAAKGGDWNTRPGIGAGEGLVGNCLQDSATVLVPNCYSDDRFEPLKDQKGSVQCTNMLCVPVPGIGNTPYTAGVLQLYNKKMGDGFDEFDTRWAEAFAREVLAPAMANLISLHDSPQGAEEPSP